jgi:3-oxoacyl-[acyl-carrier protein] reductase
MSKDGLCVIVTGSASGLGAATAGILAKRGARIVVNYSNSKNEAEATAEACRKAGAAEVVVVQGDVARDEDCQKIVAAAAPWGKLDALINNAGTTKHVAHDKLDQLSAEDFQRI